MALYDRDVMDKHSKSHVNVFYTNEICFEMDVVSHLIRHHHRDILDAIIQDLIDTGRGMVTKDMARAVLLSWDLMIIKWYNDV